MQSGKSSPPSLNTLRANVEAVTNHRQLRRRFVSAARGRSSAPRPGLLVFAAWTL